MLNDLALRPKLSYVVLNQDNKDGKLSNTSKS